MKGNHQNQIILYMHAGSGNHGCEAIVNSLCHMIDEDAVLVSYRGNEDWQYTLKGLCEIKQERSFEEHKLAHIAYYAYRMLTRDAASFLRYRYEDIFNKPMSPLAISIGGDNYCYDSMLSDLVSGSQELGNGIAAVLSGRVNPAARLPMTWYRKDEDLADINDYDIIKGKRTYQYFDRKVLYPFGYGLSYTGFTYDEMTVEDKADEIQVKLSVTNTGHCEGDEVIQLYVHKMDSRVVRPIRTLKDFVRIKNVRPGETRKVTLCAKKQELRYYDVISGQMLLEDGGYLFEVGASSVDIQQMKKLILDGQKAGVRDPFALTEAIRYDDYTNCFIHKGTFGHAEHGETCLIPGRPGEVPDEIQKLPDGKVRGELVYRDFFFEKQASKFKFTAWVLEEARIRVLSEDENHKTILVDRVLPLPEKKGFCSYEVALEEKIPELTAAKTITIQLEGKVKLKEFQFI